MHHASYFSIYYRYDRKKPVLWTQTWVWILALSFAHCIIWASYGSSLSLGFFSYNMAKAGPRRDIVWILNNHKFLIPLIYLRAGLSRGTLSSLFILSVFSMQWFCQCPLLWCLLGCLSAFNFGLNLMVGNRRFILPKKWEFTDFQN